MRLIRRRKITDQQARRLQEKNSQSSAAIDWASGVIVAHFGKQLDVQLTHNITAAHSTAHQRPMIRCHVRTHLPLLATGDRVTISLNPSDAMGCIEQLLPRKTLIARPDRYHKLKPVAANMDLLLIVFAPLPRPVAGLIDRYLLVAHLAGVDALLLLNKSDLLGGADEALTLLQEYQALGYDTLQTAHNDNASMHALKSALAGKTCLVAGQSGVGKSTLINALLPHAQQDTQAISTGSQLGQHTTTTSRLIAYDEQNLAHGGIIDTPGIREFGLWHLAKDDILGGFPELHGLLCQFRDCPHHIDSKGCALWQAAKNGMVLPRRVQSLVQLQSEAAK